MSRELWMSLANNAAMLLALFVIYELSYIITKKENIRKIISGILISAICLAIMSAPYSLFPGVRIDTRTILISVTGMIFGLVPTLMVAVSSLIYRIVVGGPGVIAGCALILSSAMIGLLWKKKFMSYARGKKWISSYIMSLIVHAVMQMFILLLPSSMRYEVFNLSAFPVMVIFPITSVLLSSLLIHQKERMVYEKKLAESEKKYRELVDNSSDILWTTDLGFNITYVSPSVKNVLGVDQEKYSYRKLEEKFSRDSIKYVDEMLQEELEREKDPEADKNRAIEVELEYLKPDGNAVWLAMNISFLRNDEGIPIGLQGISRDITGRKRAESELQTERDKIHTYMEIARVIFVAIELDMSIKMINREGCKILCTDKENILGKDWIENFIPERNRVDFSKWLNEVFSGTSDNYKVYENTIVNANGKERMISWRNAILKDSNGNVTEIIASGIDITDQEKTLSALKESERSKSVFISHLPGIAYRCAHDREWTMEFISEGCYELTGYKPEEMIGNKLISYNSIICESYRNIIWDEWIKVVYEETTFQGEYEIMTASGKKKWVLEMGQPIFDSEGKLEALEGIVIDIDESKKRYNQIQYMNDHDFLTGLYNRRYFEYEKKQLDNEDNLPLSIIIADINGLKLINDAFGHSEGDNLIVNAGVILKKCFPDDTVIARTGGDEFGVILSNTSLNQANEYIRTIESTCKEFNSNLPDQSAIINISVGAATKEENDESILEVEKEAEDSMYRQKLLDRESHHNAIITSVMATMFARSQETEEHAERLSDLSIMIGNELKLSQKNLDNLKLLSMLHDIGKIGIDDVILAKEGPLTKDEWDIMKKHPEIGYRIAMTSAELKPIARYILHHHERWDGKGYPTNLRGEEIPLLARILAVVDAYDAMTNDRVYRKAMDAEIAKAELIKNAGTQFDPEMVELFMKVLL